MAGAKLHPGLITRNSLTGVICIFTRTNRCKLPENLTDDTLVLLDNITECWNYTYSLEDVFIEFEELTWSDDLDSRMYALLIILELILPDPFTAKGWIQKLVTNDSLYLDYVLSTEESIRHNLGIAAALLNIANPQSLYWTCGLQDIK